jgi:iron complex outermembrane receptor protein
MSFKGCLLFNLVFFTNIAFCQTGKIAGTVGGTEETNTVVTLLTAKDSAFVKTTFCDSSGIFEFEKVKEGNYIITISVIGYKKYFSDVLEIDAGKSSLQLPAIVLENESKELNTVTVVSKKKFIERKIDRVVVNPDALISNTGATSLEMLEKAPGILVDVNGNISLKGKSGVIVFIDDKPTYLAAADLAGYLRSLPASSVDVIEIMTNPPAKYDAAGNAGVINIRLKKNKAKGVNGGLNLGYGQGRYFRTNNSFNINYRINKFNFFTNIAANQNNSYQDLTINRRYYTAAGIFNSAFIQNSYIKKENKGYNMRLGADYYMNSSSTLGIAFAGFINPSFSSVNNKASVLDDKNDTLALIEATTPSNKKWKNGSVNLNYTYKIDKKGKELIANFDYIAYDSKHNQTLVNTTFDGDGAFQGKTILQSSLPASILIKTVKIDFTNPMEDGGKLYAGVKTSFVNTDNTADFFDVINDVASPNYQFSNRFKYKENINAFYVNYSKDWKRFSMQAGLRAENTNITGHQLGNAQISDSNFTRKYTGLFPTFYLSWRLDTTSTHQVGFSFGRRVERPNYKDMNPFTYPLDRFTFYGGNPFLKPSYSYNFELSHTYKSFLTTTLEYSRVDDLIQESNEQRNNVYYSRPGNFGKSVGYGINVNGEFQLAKWWKLQLYTEYKNLKFKSIIYGQVLDENLFYWFVNPTNQFVITKTLSAELSASYQTKILIAQFLTTPVWQMSGGLSQKIWKGKGTIKLNVSDIFYTNQPGGDIRNISNSKADWLSYLDSRVVTIGFSYRFNKGKSLSVRQSGGSDAEKQRVRTQ